MFLRGWQGSSSGATREAIRAVHIDGPVRSVPSRKYVGSTDSSRLAAPSHADRPGRLAQAPCHAGRLVGRMLGISGTEHERRLLFLLVVSKGTRPGREYDR